MPDLTPNLGLKKPLGNETVSRTAYNENLDLIDQNAASQDEVTDHIEAAAPHSGHETPAGAQAKADTAAAAGVAAAGGVQTNLNNYRHNLTSKKLMGVLY
ncbi:MAG: hypothetical protein HPY50_04880 [Firmicutes bacterium]|nr:hypothetical protein [Bacillota bacterium]